ncbi:MAG: sigma-70 family RNA polymerase sigma factor [Arachidicoccus sp.]|nr:sigma-70 family RNA polymerase sigma factor [Arachidicoccus sp.]
MKNGDQNIFNELYFEYHAQIYGYILNKTKSPYYAEEVVQIAFIKLWSMRKKLSDDVSLRIQIFRIAKTSLIDYIRVNDKKDKLLKSLDNKDVTKIIVQNSDHEIEYKEVHFKLEKVISSLPPIRKQVFVMSRFNEMTYREISDKLNIATKTVENHINIALKQIRAFFV